MGDPASNGRGHRTGWLEGVFGVFVPGPPIRKIKRTKDIFVDKSTTHDDGTMCLSATQQEAIAIVPEKGFG